MHTLLGSAHLPLSSKGGGDAAAKTQEGCNKRLLGSPPVSFPSHPYRCKRARKRSTRNAYTKGVFQGGTHYHISEG